MWIASEIPITSIMFGTIVVSTLIGVPNKVIPPSIQTTPTSTEISGSSEPVTLRK